MKNLPPKIFLRFFHWYCDRRLVDHIEGDLIEVYQQRLRKFGKRKADYKFIIDVLQLFRPGIIKAKRGYDNLNYSNKMKTLSLNRHFYLITIFFGVVLAMITFYEGLVRFELGTQMFTLQSYSHWFLVFSLVSLIGSVLL